jgi:hypothetical protein
VVERTGVARLRLFDVLTSNCSSTPTCTGVVYRVPVAMYTTPLLHLGKQFEEIYSVAVKGGVRRERNGFRAVFGHRAMSMDSVIPDRHGPCDHGLGGCGVSPVVNEADQSAPLETRLRQLSLDYLRKLSGS